MSNIKFRLIVHRSLSSISMNNNRNFRIPMHLFTYKKTNNSHLFLIQQQQQTKRFAGHAHWQNVKHIKESGDREKSQTALYYVKAVQKAIKLGGGIRDPKINTKLAAVLAEAKSKSVPYSTLEKQLNAIDQIEPYAIELRAPGGLFVIVESRAKRVLHERQHIGAFVKKYGCTVVPSGDIIGKFFDYTGIITVSAKSSERLIDLDAAINLGIEIGAKEVKFINSGEDETYQFHCEVNEIDNLRQSLENTYKIPVLNTESIYSPKVTVPVRPEVRQTLDEMYGKIKLYHEYVDRIFDNTTIENTK
ncbi:unnamed protein product [Schistosoma turkestanicum]|nr:unnamed protein product [Schistosoma turkestanicum]